MLDCDIDGGERWYRYEQWLFTDGIVKIRCDSFPILRKTRCGVWLDLGFGEKRFVLSNAKKRWACPTKGEAMESFKARKLRQIKILDGQLKRSKEALKLIKKELE